MTAIRIVLSLLMLGVLVGALLLLIAVILQRLWRIWRPESKRSTTSVAIGGFLLLALFSVVALPTLLRNGASIGYFGLIGIGAVSVFIPWWYWQRNGRNHKAH
jgi:uncharacterized membrane protein